LKNFQHALIENFQENPGFHFSIATMTLIEKLIRINRTLMGFFEHGLTEKW
jgi:hypothetical protein